MGKDQRGGRRRGNGEGSIYFDEERQRWVGAMTIDVVGRRPRRIKVSDPTWEGARDKLQKRQSEREQGLAVASTDKVEGFLDWWLTTLEAKAASDTKSVNTVDNATWAVKRWIVPALGTKRLRELEPEHVESLLASMAAAGRSRRTVGRVRSYFGQALAVAERRGKVARNVARLAEMPETKAPKARRSLSPEQAAKLLEATKNDRLEGLYVTGLMLGLRPGELTGLRWPDVDLDAGTLVVDVSLKRERGKLRLGDTKTAKSRRPLSLPAPVRAALRAHRKRQLEERVKAGAAWQDTGILFTTVIGTPIDPSNLRRAFGELTEIAGIGRWTPNELRHSAASLLSAAGVPLEVIADVLGHSSTRMLELHYRHATRPTIDAHVDVMDGLFGKAGAGD